MTTEVLSETAVDERPRVGCAIAMIVGMIAAGVLALPFVNILSSILIPPNAPLPNVVMSEVSHQNYAYGVDEWVYDTTTDPCELVAYYESSGGVCTVTPLQCNRSVTTTGDFGIENQVVSRCTGSSDFTLFSLSWWALIIRNDTNPNHGRVNVWREINWLGSTSNSTAHPNNAVTSP